MTNDSIDTYNGWPNRETWAFDLHMTNDEVLYTLMEEWATDAVREWEPSYDGQKLFPLYVGEYIRERFEDFEGEAMMDADDLVVDYGERHAVYPDWLDNLRRDVGSFWRIDWAEIGEHAMEIADQADDA